MVLLPSKLRVSLRPEKISAHFCMNIRLLSLAMSCAILASCSGSVSNSNQARKAAANDAAAIGLCDSFAIAQFAMDTTEAARLADAFLEAYRHDDEAGRFTADAASISIPNDVMMAFEGLAPHLDPATQCLGVRIAYGLEEDARPIFLFAPVVMSRVPSAAGTLDFQLGEAAAWYDPASGDWQPVTDDVARAAMERYAGRVMKYVDGNLRPLHIDPSLGSASDPSGTFFPFTEFRELIQENQRQLQEAFGDRNEIPSITAVRLRWAAENLGEDGTLKQIVVMIPVLDGPDYPGPQRPLTLKAADLNNLCPSNCAGSVVSYRGRSAW